jgi:hypothetical protein
LKRQRSYQNPVLDIIWNLKLRRQYYHLNHEDGKRREGELRQYDYLDSLKQVARILSSEALLETLWYLLEHGAATDFILYRETNFSDRTIRWARSQLQAMRLIEPATRLPKEAFEKGGKKVRVWMVEGALPGEIRDAMILHQRLKSPKYRVAVEVAQTLLDEHLEEITFREILKHVKGRGLPYPASDVAELTAQYLHERGVKIWR